MGCVGKRNMEVACRMIKQSRHTSPLRQRTAFLSCCQHPTSYTDCIYACMYHQGTFCLELLATDVLAGRWAELTGRTCSMTPAHPEQLHFVPASLRSYISTLIYTYPNSVRADVLHPMRLYDVRVLPSCCGQPRIGHACQQRML